MFRPKPGARIELHILKSHAASRLNRDGADRPKTMYMGGCRRLRISSQAEKYSIRTSEIFNQFLAEADSKYGATRMVRTRHAVSAIKEKLTDKILSAGKEPRDYQEQMGKALATFNRLFQKRKVAQEEDIEDTQLVAFSLAEIEHIADIVFSKDRNGKIQFNDVKEIVKELHRERTSAGPMSVELQLFGRFTTAFNYLKNIDAPLSVSHGFTVHEARIEQDYWTAVDDLNQLAGRQGGGHIDSRSFGAGIFYHYYCLDVPLLSRNVAQSFTDLDEAGTVSLIQDLISAFLYAALCRNPVGGQSGHANHDMPGYAYVTYGNAFPYNAQDAFENPVTSRGEGYYVEAKNAFASWMDQRRKRYGIFCGYEQGMGFEDLNSDLQTMVESTVEEATSAIYGAMPGK